MYTHSVYRVLTPQIHFGHYPPVVLDAVKPVTISYLRSVASDKK